MLVPRPRFQMPTGEGVEVEDLQHHIPDIESSNSSRGEAYAEDEEECYFERYSGLGGERDQCTHIQTKRNTQIVKGDASVHASRTNDQTS